MLIFWSYGKLKVVPVLKIWRYLNFLVNFRVSGGGAEGTTEITLAVKRYGRPHTVFEVYFVNRLIPA